MFGSLVSQQPFKSIRWGSSSAGKQIPFPPYRLSKIGKAKRRNGLTPGHQGG